MSAPNLDMHIRCGDTLSQATLQGVSYCTALINDTLTSLLPAIFFSSAVVSLQPYCDQIDQVESSVSALEQMAYRLDAYCKRLEAKFREMERR